LERWGSGLVIRHRLGFDARTMTHRAAPNRFRWLFLGALIAAMPSAALAQSQAKTPPPSPKAFTASVKAAKHQADALVKQTAAQATRTQKALTETLAARAKITDADAAAKKDEIAALEQKIAAQKSQVAFQLKVAGEAAAIQTGLGAASSASTTAGAGVCSSDSKGVKPPLVTAKRAVDGIVGSSAAAISAARTEEKQQTATQVKQSIATYAKNLQTLATAASTLSTALKKLEEQASLFPPCP
jgi:septal ring factor EnvC (AmiA/AmiB activator)